MYRSQTLCKKPSQRGKGKTLAKILGSSSTTKRHKGRQFRFKHHITHPFLSHFLRSSLIDPHSFGAIPLQVGGSRVLSPITSLFVARLRQRIKQRNHSQFLHFFHCGVVRSQWDKWIGRQGIGRTPHSEELDSALVGSSGSPALRVLKPPCFRDHLEPPYHQWDRSS